MQELFKYKCNLNIEGFIHTLDDPAECYKFYWLDAILVLVSRGQYEFTFDDVISGMIADAWSSVKEYHLCMGTKDAKGRSVNSIERAINKLDSLQCLEYMADRDTVLELIRQQDKLLHNEKYQISKYVPYRLLSSFMKEIGGNDPLWNQRTRLITYMELLNQKECLPYTIGNERGLGKRIHIDPDWRKFFTDNMVSIRGWIQMKKIRYLQDRNPGVPGIVYKVGPENEKQRKLQNVRKLWDHIIEVATVQDIYSGSILEKWGYEIDHFVPWSYVANDEMWNLIPVGASLNSSKRDRLPDWERYFKGFAQNQFILNESIYKYSEINRMFQDCRRDNLNALWSIEELYVEGIHQNKFMRILEERLKPLYDSAHILGYDVWFAGKI